MLPDYPAFSRSDLPGVHSFLALHGENVLPFPAVNSLFIPWDFVLVLVFLGAIIPWRGAARMKRLMSKPEITTADRLSLYGSTIIFQWLIVAIVALRSAARTVSPEELGLAARDPWQVVWTSIALTGILCINQVVGFRRITRMPESKRGSVFAITEKIMPRTRAETLVFSALAFTAGVSEEFLYRGFVFMAFVIIVRMVLAGAFVSRATGAYNNVCSRTNLRTGADMDRESGSNCCCSYWHRFGRWDLCI